MNNTNIFYRQSQANEQDKFSPLFSSDQEIEEDSDENIFEKQASKNDEEIYKEFGILETLQDIGEQVISKGISGIGGAYGNILEAVGLQSKKGQEVLPGQKEIYNIQSDILEKINRGETPSFSELMLLSDDDIMPNYTRLPTSSELQSGIQQFTGIGEGKTPAGRIFGQGSQFIGEGIPFGGGNKALKLLGGAGIAGQAIREAGGPEALATGIEIGAPLLHGGVSKKLAPTTKGAKEIVEAGRKIGLSESQIAPLIQTEVKAATLSKVARKGTKTKKLFTSIKEKLGDSYDTIKSSPEAKVKLPNADQIMLRKEFGQIRNEMSKTLAPSPDKEAALNYIEKSLETLRDTNVTPEYLVNFWQDVNRSVNWNSLRGGKKALAQLKEPVSNILKKTSPKLAEDFELTNELYTKYAQISKKLKPDLVESFVSKGEVLSGIPSALALAYGNPLPLTALGGEVSARLLAREMLINPYFQNISKKLVTNINSGSIKGVTNLVTQVKEYMERKHPNQDWSFLTKEIEED